jgi:small subunit ribosomal protein S1
MVKVVRPEDANESSEISPHEFEQMLEDSLEPETVYPGEIVSGTVVSIGRDWVFVDIGCKSEGLVAVDEFIEDDSEDDPEPQVKLGDMVEATVLTLRGGIRLSRSLKKSSQSDDVLQDAYENKIPVEGRVTESRKGGFGVAVGSGHQAFCPISQIDLKYVENADEYVDQTFTFRIIEFSDDLRNIVVSRRALLEEEQQAQARETRERIKPGLVLDGTVKRVMPYGAFVDIGGMDGLVHVSEIAWDRVENPEEYVQEGKHVTVKVLSFDPAKDKLALSIREAGSNPWDDIEQRFPASTNVSGTVTRVEPYGAFVRIATGIEGLVHVSDMTWSGRIRHAGDVVNVGDSVQVIVMGIDRERKRISLGMKQVHGDPFETAVDKFSVGQAITGTVQRIGAGGVFIELEEGVVAFLPGSLSGVSKGEPLSSRYRTSTNVKLAIREIDPERRRITLESTDGESQAERKEYERYMSKQKVAEEPASGGLGSFGELLKKALKDK